MDANIFGVFDGHGGKQAAQYASRNLLGRLRDKLGASEISLISHSSSGSSSSANLSPCLSAESTAEAALQAGEASSNANDDTVPEQLRKCDSISSEAWDTWHAQDAVVDTLPRSLSSTFASIQEDFLAGTKVISYIHAPCVTSYGGSSSPGAVPACCVSKHSSVPLQQMA